MECALPNGQTAKQTASRQSDPSFRSRLSGAKKPDAGQVPASKRRMEEVAAAAQAEIAIRWGPGVVCFGGSRLPVVHSLEKCMQGFVLSRRLFSSILGGCDPVLRRP